MESILVLSAIGTRFLSLAVAILTKRYLLGLAVLAFSVGGVVMLVTSAFFASGGWWQNILVEVGAGLLLVGLVDLAILGALRRLIEPGAGQSVTVHRGDGSKVLLTGADEATLAIVLKGSDLPTNDDVAARLQVLTAAIQRMESRLSPPPPA